MSDKKKIKLAEHLAAKCSSCLHCPVESYSTADDYWCPFNRKKGCEEITTKDWEDYMSWENKDL